MKQNYLLYRFRSDNTLSDINIIIKEIIKSLVKNFRVKPSIPGNFMWGFTAMLALVFLFESSIPAAQPVKDSKETILTPRQMLDDLAFIRLKILSQHSHPFLYTSS